MDQEDNTGVSICRPLAALELGFHTRMLRTLQESVWAVKLQDIHNVDAGLESIHRRLVALSDRLNQLQFDLFRELKTRIEDRHDTAAEFKGQLRGELLAEVDDPEEAMRRLPRRIEERASVLRGWQKQDWEEIRLLSWKAVEGDRRLEAWWEIGLRMADMILRVGTPETPATWTEADVKGLLKAISNLPPEEKAWVEDMLPILPPTEPRFPFLLNDSYKDLREFIPEFEKRRRPGSDKETRPAEEFVPSDNYRRCRWRDRPEYEFNESQALMIKALHEDFLRVGTGLSAAKLFSVTKLRRRQKRVEHVFRNFKDETWVTHPALTDGFLIQESGVWRLDLEKHEKHKD